MEINASILKGCTTEFNRSLTTAFRLAAKRKELASFNAEEAKAAARLFVLGQVNYALNILDSGDVAK